MLKAKVFKVKYKGVEVNFEAQRDKGLDKLFAYDHCVYVVRKSGTSIIDGYEIYKTGRDRFGVYFRIQVAYIDNLTATNSWSKSDDITFTLEDCIVSSCK